MPRRTAAGYRLYGLARAEPAPLAARPAAAVPASTSSDLAFALRLRREPELRRAVDGWLAAGDDTGSWIDWEQRKHERLLAA